MRSLTTYDLFEFQLLGDGEYSSTLGQLLYVESKADPDDNTYHTHIARLGHDAGEPQSLTQGPCDSHPRVSPDGQ